MAIVVRTPDYDEFRYDTGTGVRTEEEHNNLEVVNGDGHIIAVYAGRCWGSAEVVT